MKKTLAVVLCICMLIAALPLGGFAGESEKLDVFTARAVANFYGASITFIDGEGEEFLFGEDFYISGVSRIYEYDEVVAYGFGIQSVKEETDKAYTVIGRSLDEPLLYLSGWGEPDWNEITLNYIGREKPDEAERQKNYEDNTALIEAIDDIINSDEIYDPFYEDTDTGRLTQKQVLALAYHYAKNAVFEDEEGNSYTLADKMSLSSVYSYGDYSSYDDPNFNENDPEAGRDYVGHIVEFELEGYDYDIDRDDYEDFWDYYEALDSLAYGYIALDADLYGELYAGSGVTFGYSGAYVYFEGSDGLTEEEKLQNYRDNSVLISSVMHSEEFKSWYAENGTQEDEYEDTDDSPLVRFIERIIEKLSRFLEYFLGSVGFGDYANGKFYEEQDMKYAQKAVDAAVRRYVRENGCTVKNSYSVDKNYCKPQTHEYFAQDYDIGDGICGIAAWEIALGYYRDALGYNLPDDQTMFKELIAIYDDINVEAKPVMDVMVSVSDLIDRISGEDIGLVTSPRAFEFIGTLDLGIYRYLKSKGYEQAAQNVFKNLRVGLPIVSAAAQNTLVEDIRSKIFGGIGGSIAMSAKDVTLEALKKGEPVVLGNWVAIGKYSYYTNHYITAVGLYEISETLELPSGGTYTYTRNIVEVYDTWDTASSGLIDFDTFNIAACYDANTLATL